jgi:thiamine-phosphate diphosphorylase
LTQRALASRVCGLHVLADASPRWAHSPVEQARARLLLGRSTHTLEQAAAARCEPIDYLAFGPIFGTRSKDSPWGPRGLAQLAEVVRSVRPLPVVAIGGIDADNAASVRAAGAAGFAVISAVAGSDQPEAATRELVAAWGREADA